MALGRVGPPNDGLTDSRGGYFDSHL
jgi:hypothetical protein